MSRTGDEQSRRVLLYQRWSAAYFELADGAPPVEVRRKLLEKLDADDLVPSDECRTALRVATGLTNAATLQYGQVDCGEEGRLSQEVESFAGDFFSLSVEKRLERWGRLFEETTGYAAVQARLHELARGLNLNVDSVAKASQNARQLADGMLRRFVLPAWERGPLRRQELAERTADFSRSRKAALELQSKCAGVAALDPDLLRELTDKQQQKVVARRTVAKSQAAETGGGGSSGGVPWVIIAVVLGVLRAVTGLSTGHKEPPKRPAITFPQNWQSGLPPRIQQQDWQPAGRTGMQQEDHANMFAALANIFDESPGPEIKELESQLKQHPENHKLRNQLADKHLKLARDAIKHQSSRQVLLRAAAAADQYQLLVQKIPQDRNAACKYVESWMIIADYTDKDRRDLLEKILKQTLPVARQLAAKKDALPEDRQRLLEVLDKSIRLRRTQSQWGPALELAREAAQISRVALAQDQDQLALRVQLEAHLAVISDILIESKKP